MLSVLFITLSCSIHWSAANTLRAMTCHHSYQEAAEHHVGSRKWDLQTASAQVSADSRRFYLQVWTDPMRLPVSAFPFSRPSGPRCTGSISTPAGERHFKQSGVTAKWNALRYGLSLKRRHFLDQGESSGNVLSLHRLFPRSRISVRLLFLYQMSKITSQ